MKNYFLALLLLLPFAAQAQLTADSPNATKPTQWLTGKPESVYVFFDKATATLRAQDATATDFTWYLLDPATSSSLTLQKTEIGVASSSLTITVAGGYQVVLNNAARDTFSCWVFFDNFKIDDITSVNNCDALRLDMTSTPSIYTGYTIYNFEKFINPPHVGDSTYSGIKTIHWDAIEDIHHGVDNPDESWKNRKYTYTYIDAPPPLKNSKYTIAIEDVFGKSASYTTPTTIPAIAAYAKISAEELLDNQWRAVSDPPKGEALYQIRFSPKESLNAQKFYWKGFGNENTQNAGKLVMWRDSTTTADSWTTPKTPYKGSIVEGYVPGKYTVRLTARNLTTGCADSTDLKGIEVSSSKFSSEAIPNAFTPNGDGQNDIFKFVKGNEPVSMEYVKIYIYSRSGMLVYRYEGRADAWTGWDGRLMGNRGEVADGVYFYVISGEGWDGVQYNTAEYKGSLHIFR